MVKESKFGKMVLSTMENGVMEKQMESGHFIILMETCTKENSRRIEQMGKESIAIKTALGIKELGKMI